MTEQKFRTQPPWHGEDADKVPAGHVIVAEFPSVTWGWECDMYYWIIHDPSGRLYLGASSHGRFYEAKTSELREQIQELQSHIEATKQALTMLGELQP